MAAEESKGNKFPIGMRVLAVDDDLTCLKLLEALLRRCQYNVTTTNQPITALKLLRENKDGFDLVISDVHMPDMDGFKLLELVGLEMDLPVIMLSANGETSAVMKGITHGACDYLLKPVRIEELRNIWQHVIRRRKFENKDHNNFDQGYDAEKPQANSENGHSSITNGSSEHNGKLNRKRKDHDPEDEDDIEENTNENEDPTMQKKPRVVWSLELHRKFVAAVNQLGIDKAVPKRILDLMNVEKLTRENVASHLQKYRLYLKRLNAAASHQANMVASLGGRDPSNLPMGSLDGYRNFNAFVISGQLPALQSFQSSGLLNGTNYPTRKGLHVLPSTEAVQSGCTNNNISNPINDVSKFHSMILPGSHHGNLHQGLPATWQMDHLQQKRAQDPNSYLPGGYSVSRPAPCGSRNSFVNATNNSLLLQSNQHQTQARGLGSHSSANIPSLNSDPFEMTVGSSSHFPDLARCNASLQSSAPLTKYSTNATPVNPPLINSDLAPSNVAELIAHVDGNHHDGFRNVPAAPLHAAMTGIDAQCQASSLGGNMMFIPMTTSIDEDCRSMNSRHTGNSKQKTEEHTQDDSDKPDLIQSSSISPSWSNYPVGHLSEDQRMHGGLLNVRAEINAITQSNVGASFPPQFGKIDKSTDGQMKYECDMEASKFQGGLRSNGGSLDDLVNAMIKLV